MKVWIIWEARKGGWRIKEIYANQEQAYSRLLSFTDFPDPVDAEYHIEEWDVEENK